MAINTTDIQQAIAAAEALDVTDAQLYQLAKTAVADALKAGMPTTTISLPTGVSYQVAVEPLLLRLPDLRRAAQAENSPGIAFGAAVLP
jgi:hypothetical protein